MLHRLLASTALSLCFLGFLTGSGVAHAKDNEPYFFPKNKWVVEEVADQESPTCTISNQLNNGYIIQFAGTQSGFSNINLDLRQDIFEAGFRYEVEYSVPGVASTIIPTKAFKKNLLVSDLRQEKDFVKALRESNVLDVRIQSNEFRIYLTGLGSKMKSFNDCVYSSMDIARVPSQSTRVSSAQILSHGTHAQSASITAPPPPAADLEERVISISRDADQVPRISRQIDIQPSKNPRYTQELAEQMKEDSKAYLPDISDEESESYKAPSEQKKSVRDLSQGTLEEQTRAVIDDPFFNTKFSKTRAEADFTQLKEDDVSALEPASGALAGGGAIFKDDGGSHSQRISLLEQEIAALRAQNKDLSNELHETLADAKSETVSVSSHNWNLERATMRFNEAEIQIQRLGQQLQAERARCDGEKAELETILFDPTITAQQQLAKLASLEKELEATKAEFYRQQRHYEERIKLLEGQLSAQGL